MVVVLATGCRQVFGFQEPVIAPDDSDTAVDSTPADIAIDVDANAWTKRKRIVVDGTQVVGTHENFPLLVRFTDQELADVARPDGFDLLFTDGDGVTKLAHEIERFTPAGELVAWVRVPVLMESAPTELYLYFGNPSSADQQARTAVWDADYVGVWHLGEPSGTTVADSTSFARDGVKVAATKPAPQLAASIGGGQSFGGTDDGISIGHDPILDIQDITFEVWLQRASCTDTVVRRIIDFTVDFQFSYAIAYACDAALQTHDNAILLDLPNAHVETGINTFMPGTPHHLVFLSNPTRVFIDGVERGTTTTPITLAQDNINTIIGNRESSVDRATIGVIDEVRISRVNRAAAYIETSFANQRAGSTLLTIGPTEPAQP